jgi:hypothetical protein
MNVELQTARAAKIWDALIPVAEAKKTTTYKELSEVINVHPRALRHALEFVQVKCAEKELPPLTSLVVGSITGIPGAGNSVDAKNLKSAYEEIFSHTWTGEENPFIGAITGGTHSWWSADPDEKYWIESTDRKDLGINLIAPISSNAGQKLVAFVEDGDIILHYFQPAKAIVAFSVAQGFPKESTIRWPDRKASNIGPAYEMKLVNFTELTSPITLKDIQSRELEIRRIKTELDVKFNDQAIYYPYQIPKNSVIQPAQGMYLSKLPKAVFQLFPDFDLEITENVPKEYLEIKRSPRTLKKVDLQRTLTPTGKSGQGYQSDEKKKKATELHAMRLAFDYLSKEGYTSKDVSNQKNIGYDIHANKGENMLGVEVKGSINRADFVNVTSSEVEYTQGVSENNYQSLLFVVDNIQVIKNGEIYETSGGRIRMWWNWDTGDGFLIPISYRFTLPAEIS